MTTENNGASGNSPMPLDESWVLALLGSRTLLGKKVMKADGVTAPHWRPELSPVYQIEVRPQPQQVTGPDGKPAVIVQRPRFIMGVCEMDGFDSLELPEAGIILKPVVDLPLPQQNELAQLVANYERARTEGRRKQLIDAQAAAAMKSQSFGGGARKE